MPSPPTLTTLPWDVFLNIASATVTPSNPGPPKSVLNLLLTSKAIRTSIDCPAFYASIFDIQFDTAALKRRFHSSRFTTSCRAAELKRRWIALKRIRRHARGRNAIWGYPGYPGIYSDRDKLGDAWLAFLMITEDDGQNIVQLEWANVADWTRSFVYFDIHILSARAQQSGQLPQITELRALGLWLYWMTTKFDDILIEPVAALSKVNRMLRPFTFASWAYPSFFAPWQLSHIPPPASYAPSSSTEVALDTGTPAAPPQPHAPTSPAFYRPNFLPPTVVLPSYLGHPLPLTPPLINHCAALLFFTRMQRFRLGEEAATQEDLDVLKAFRAEKGPRATYTPPYARTKYVVGDVGSEVWDEDVLRLGGVSRTLKTKAIWKTPEVPSGVPLPPTTKPDATVVDLPQEPAKSSTPGMKRFRYVPGTFAGDWEGRFVIYGLDAHQNIAQGVPGLQALESTQLTQDPQAWSLREYHHPSVLPSKHKERYTTTFPNPPPSHLAPSVRPVGPPLNAFIPVGATISSVSGGLEVYAGVRDRSERQGVFYAEVGRCKVEDEDDEESWADQDPVKEDLNGRDDVDVIIEGESMEPRHTIPGRQTMMPFGSKVTGTIRRWDGLITLLATPPASSIPIPLDSDSESESNDGPKRPRQWLYRGYMTANGNFVGRWRDTWNDVNVEGYEGVFVMTKRS